MPGLSEVLTGKVDSDSVTLPVASYRFTFRVTMPIHFPEYAGSMIRGAFGNALRRTACMTHQSDCKSCPLYRTCPYTAIFETPPPVGEALQKFSQIPNAYVIEPPVWGRRVFEAGEELSFGLILFGRARDQLALIIWAFQRAFRHEVGHGKAELVSVHRVDLLDENKTSGVQIFAPNMQYVADHDATSTLSIPSGNRVQIRMLTPMRLQQNGVPLGPDRLTSRAFFMTLVRRGSLLSMYQNGEPLNLDFKALGEESDAVRLNVSMGWKDWTRYSSRQKQTMSLGGVVGTLAFDNLSPALRVFLAVGLLTHVGKNASFGLGKYVFDKKGIKGDGVL